MKCRVKYLIKVYLWTVLVFILAKVAFMLFCREGHEFTFGDIFQVVWHGLSLDLSTALYFLIVPFLLSIVNIWYWVNWLTHLLRGYYILISLVFALAFVADTSLYPFWQFKLESSCLQYLDTPTEAMASVTAIYIIIRILAFAVVSIVIFCGYRNIYLQANPGSTKSKCISLSLHLIAIPLIVIGIRGGLDESTTNIGQVYFSQNQFLNHSAVNPLFSFFDSLDRSGIDVVNYDFYTEEECKQITDNLYFTTSEQTDTLLTKQRPNIIIIIMESCGGQFTEIGGNPEITPHLNRLCHEGIYFTECYANSWRTDKGVVSILSGYPAFPITSIMKIPEKSRKLPSIALSLQREGYHNSFIYGGDINFTNMRSYVMSTGYGKLIWKADYPESEQKSARWGVKDETTFATLLDEVKKDTTQHWMKTLLTLSSHEPWDVPTHVLEDEVYNSFNYLDNSIGQFIDNLKQTPAWDNTLVVILPDHGYRYKGINEDTRLFNHIPMLWLGGAVKEPRIISKVCNQTDLAATLLGQIGITHDEFDFSRDVISPQYEHQFAFHTFNNGVSLIDSTGFVAYDLDAQQIRAKEGSNYQNLLKRAFALLQLFSKDIIKK